MNKPILNDSVVGGDLHSGDVVNNYYISEVKPVAIKVKKKRPKRKGTWVKLYALSLLDFIKVLLLMAVSMSGIFFLLIMVGVTL